MNLFHHVSSSRLYRIFAAICLLAVLATPCLADDSTPAPYSYEWFMQPDDSAPVKSCVHIFTQGAMPALLTYDPSFDTEYAWKVQFLFEETTGIPFHIEKMTHVTFGAENCVISANDYLGEELSVTLPMTTIERGSRVGFNINILPGNGETAFAVAIEGKDALGNPLTFTCLAPLSYEISKELTRVHFTLSDAQEEGKPFIAITAGENPIPQIYDPVFSGDYGWVYSYAIENVTDEPFTISRIVEAYLVGDRVTYFSEYTPEQLAQWGVSTELIKGDPFTGGSGANTQQGFTELGLLVEGTDKDGNAMTFAALIPFSQERPQE